MSEFEWVSVKDGLPEIPENENCVYVLVALDDEKDGDHWFDVQPYWRTRDFAGYDPDYWAYIPKVTHDDV